MSTTTHTDVQHVLIGTAGHIDHGKTRLVARLTQVDTDRLPEEKARGISIDLGFAHWEANGFRFGVVDVPGHERFVRNMVAGATGINLALLVVAADDSVMPQTREHLEIMQLLGIQHGVIAITKTDLVDEEMPELVEEEIRELVANTFLERARIIRVSSETGAGLETLREEICAVASEITRAPTHDFFRMPIDRAFSLTGHGTIVTGSVLHGSVQAGQTLELLPDQTEVRVRSVQNHHSASESAGARQRTAINLAGVKLDDVPRGKELATPHQLRPTRRLLVKLTCLSSSPIKIKDRLTLSLHIGTTELPARVILKGHTLARGENGYAELRLRVPVIAAHGQRFILRRISPARTIAGGTVLDPNVEPLARIRDLPGYGAALDTNDPNARLEYLLAQQLPIPVNGDLLATRAGVRRQDYPQLVDQLRESGKLRSLQHGDQQLLVHNSRLNALLNSARRLISAEIERNQPRRSLPLKVLKSTCQPLASSVVIDAVLAELIAQKHLVKVGHNFGPADAQVQLTKRERNWLQAVWDDIREAERQPPTRKELMARHSIPADVLQNLMTVLIEDEAVVDLDGGMAFAPEALETLREELYEYFAQHPQATLSEIRQVWNVSRKYALPVCEYFDRTGITARAGDQRTRGA